MCTSNKFTAGVLVVVAIALSACTLTRGSSVLIGASRTPLDVSEVKLYTELPTKYEKIAIISADSRNDFASQQNLADHAIDRLKKEAAKVGANGVLLNGIGNYQIGSHGVITVPNAAGPIYSGTAMMNMSTGKEATGIAIHVPKE